MLEMSLRWVRRGVLLFGITLAGCAGLPSLPGGVSGEVNLDGGQTFPAEAEFTGAVEAIDATAWRVAGLGFIITPETEIKGSIGLGDTVKVHAQVAADGSLTAREVELQQIAEVADTPVAGDEVEFTGPVEAISDTSWTIGGTLVGVTPETEIDPGLALGDFVKVHALLAVDGTLAAREIDRVDTEEVGDEPDDIEVKLVGTVEVIGPASWTISGVLVLVSSGTDIDEGITVGSLVRVEALADASGVLTATEIEMDEGDESESGEDLEDGEDDDSDDGADEADDDDGDGDNSGHGGSDD